MISHFSSPLNQFATLYPHRDYPAGEVVLPAHVESDSFFYLDQGAVKMVRTTPEGRSLVLHIFFPQSLFALLDLIMPTGNPYEFITIVPARIHRIPKSDVIAFLHQHPDEMFALQQRLLHGLAGLLKRIETTSLLPAYNQVAQILVYFATHFPDTPQPTIAQAQLSIKLTHQEIADWLGLSRENVSLQMKQLERNKLLTPRHNRIEIIDLIKLQQLANHANYAPDGESA